MAALYYFFPKNLVNALGAVVVSREEPLFFGLILASIAITVISILSYKKRKLQFVLNRLAILSNFVLLGIFVYRTLKIAGESWISEKGIGAALPIVSIVFLVLANKAIKRDEDLVKSVDRLR